MFFASFLQAGEFCVSNLFLQNRFRALQDEGRFRAKERVLISLSQESKSNIMERSLLTIIKTFEVDPVLGLLAYAQMSEIEWQDSDSLGW